MSKEHKMNFRGKKYITKISNGCVGCSFYCVNMCKIETASDKSLGIKNEDDKNRVWDKCIGSENEDRMQRIWVEDKTEIKPKKDCVWVIEELYGNDWLPVSVQRTRKLGRDYADTLKDMCGIKVRVRKFTGLQVCL